ncbi:Holliday junction resolvase RecU [Lacticaseibacillus rhamnosus]|uniref:Holliday junction resolvase RecU n=1 Tax=Lacticaseibacillus rhamnosus TaxID=47715 RepID=UPI00194DD864|nr:Holliday junction resolvase RecU [Lacticaseibacillus rhamnosus]MBM6441116.1 Holliday junction resolvase RecU [Lacticaseibacillus rhamnosus]
MTIRYPNGNPYKDGTQFSPDAVSRPTIYGGRGMTLEEELNLSNQYYRSIDKAVVYKKPTPVQIVKVDYPRRSQAVIREAYFKTPSTTDYNGVYRGYYLDFEAKETKNKTSFPLKNFHQHQIDHFRRCLKQNGICFVVIRFATIRRLFVFPAGRLIACWDQQSAGGRKSIPLTKIIQHGFELHPQLQPVVPFLDGVDWLIETKVGNVRG